MLTAPCLSQSIDDPENFREVTRMYYGVVFTPVRYVSVITDVWSHVFDLHLPNVTAVEHEFHLLHFNNATSNVQQKAKKQPASAIAR